MSAAGWQQYAPAVKLARVSRGLTQLEIARASGIDFWRYTRIERGLQTPLDDEIAAVVRAINVSALTEAFADLEAMR